MCGIVAAVAKRNIIPVLINGLLKLEYRGYDSAGIAAHFNGVVERHRSVGRVADLSARVQDLDSHIGIAHTRWATHGAPSVRNAHPHMSNDIAVVHNGIIENYAELKAKLLEKHYDFESDTDTEVIVHLINFYTSHSSSFLMAVKRATQDLKGAYSIAVTKSGHGSIILARNGGPLILGLTDHGYYAASDVSALLQVTDSIIYLEDGDIAEINVASYQIFDDKMKKCNIDRSIVSSKVKSDATEIGEYRHFMQKEIFEQPAAIANTLEQVFDSKAITPNELFLPVNYVEKLFNNAEDTMSKLSGVLILACGTSCHSGMVAKYWIEKIAKLPCSVEIASEYRYRDAVYDPNVLVVTISQSGETADTLAALKYAKSKGMLRTLSICNVAESSLVRESSLKFLTSAGPEIGVASTKAFTTQLAALALLTFSLAKLNGKWTIADEEQCLKELRHLPVAVTKVLALEPRIMKWATTFAHKQHTLFLGRGHHYPIAMEGALKLKEISYIHAEAYAAGELKHGPLALVDDKMPVVVIAPNDDLLEKLKSNMQEVRARGGKLYVFADLDSELQDSDDVKVIHMPEHYGMLSPILHIIPLQLLSYHVALVKGTDVDKPRNLAKSVTVE